MQESGNEDWFKTEWGRDDELGTLNYITPGKTLEAAKLVRQGKTIQLGHPVYNGMPGRYYAHGPFFYLISQRTYDLRPPFREETRNRLGGQIGRVEMTDHLGTHLDALNHISRDGKFYNGNDAYEITGPKGTTKLGIDTTPGIATRGVMVDATKGANNIVEKGKPVTVEQVERFLDANSLEVGKGDAVFFYTGVSKLWDRPDEYNTYYDASPGIGMELARWISDRGVSVTGADVPSSEVVPAETRGERLPVHQHLLTKHGIRLIDNIKLDELSREKVYEFMFVCSPMRIRGGTGSPVNPAAIY